MGFLKKLLTFPKICIQCHDNPDADTVASAFGVYCYLKERGVEAQIIYGGPDLISKSSLKTLINVCGIPIRFTDELPECDLLLTIDCQYGNGNVHSFPAERIAVIDHHVKTVADGELVLIRSDYQSCSTLIFELLRDEGVLVPADSPLGIALLFGLYTDTSCFSDLYVEHDIDVRKRLFADQPLFEQLSKSNLTIAELMVATDAMHCHYFDLDHNYAIVEALSCDQAVLGVIGDFMIRVDIIRLSFAYTRSGDGYQISLRTCGENMPANKIAAWVCDGIGAGGGHPKKAGGYIHSSRLKEKYPDKSIFDVVQTRLNEYFTQAE